MWEAILGIAGPLVGILLRHWVSERQWKRVRQVASVIAKDPARTNDPREAIEEALLQVLVNRLAREAEKVKALFNSDPQALK